MNIIIIIFIFTSFTYADELQKVRVSYFEGGQNSADLSSVISANQGVLVKNAIINKKGQIFKRKGQRLFCADEENTPYTGVGVYNPDPNTSYLIAASGNKVVKALVSAASWTTVNPSNLLTPGKDTEFIQANDLFFLLNGYDYTANYNGTLWDPGATTPGATSNASPPIATTGAWLRNYFFVAGNPTYPDWVYFSDNLSPKLFQVGSNVLKVNTGDGQKIVRLEPFKLNELIIYKADSIWVLDISGSTPLTDWTLQPITTSTGCIAPRSVISIGNDHWFLSSEPFAVRSLVRTSFDKLLVDMVSQPIQDIFDQTGSVKLNTTYASKACSVLYDNKYFIAFPTGTSTVNNYVAAYDFIAKAWVIIDGWFPAKWIVFEDSLYYMDALDGRVVKCFDATYSDMASGPVNTSALEPTQAITFDYRSKAIDFDNPENFKLCDALEVEFESVGDYTAEVFLNLDSSGWQSIGTVEFTGDAPTLPNTLPIALSSANISRKTFQIQQYGEFKKIQVRVLQNGVNQQCNLHSYTLFAYLRKWRRE